MGIVGHRIILGHMASTRSRPFGVEQLVQQTAAIDGKEVEIGIEQDPASAGAAEAASYIRLLKGYNVIAHPVSKNKLVRYKPFSAQAQAGNVWMVRGEWNESYLNESEAFNDPDWKDDQIDVTSGGFNTLMDAPETAAAENWAKAKLSGIGW